MEVDYQVHSIMAEAAISHSEATDLAGASGGNIINTRTSTSSSSSRNAANSNGLVVAAKSNGSRPNDSTNCVCSLDIPRRLAYEWQVTGILCSCCYYGHMFVAMVTLRLLIELACGHIVLRMCKSIFEFSSHHRTCSPGRICMPWQLLILH